MAPVLANISCPLNSSPGLKVGAFSADGPAYIFGSDGTSCYGQGLGNDGKMHDRGLDTSVTSGNVTDTPYIAAFGQAAIGDLTGHGDLVLATPTAGLMKTLDVVLAAHQLGAQNGVTAWCLTVGVPVLCPGGPAKAHLGYPSYMNDLMFLAGPAIADVTGNGMEDVLQGSASSDFRAKSPLGQDEPGWQKDTGGWTVDTPAVGTVGTDQHQKVANITREGTVELWQSPAPACARADWPRFHHDQWNTGDYGAVATRPAAIRDVAATRAGSSVTLTFTAPHGSLFCGDARGYEVYYSTSGPIQGSNAAATRYTGTLPAPAAAGQLQTISLTGMPTGSRLWVDIQAVNGATRNGGNLGAPSNTAGWGSHNDGLAGWGVGVLGSSTPLVLPNTSRGVGITELLFLSPAMLLALIGAVHLRSRRRART
jgi:hypothetical protein